MTQEIKREKHEIDATDQAPGRIATQIAVLLMGKNKPGYTPHIDAGDFVTVINASKMKFTGRKLEQKDYLHHTMYPGGLKRTPMKKIFEKDPGEVVRRTLIKMLPKNRLRNDRMKRLEVKA
jgi:large subunit ribosomal protein L13